MKAEIITVGTELLFGDTIDTHSSFLSRECRQLGISIQYHTSIGDVRDHMYELFELATQRSDLVIVCGGLGPTMDDMTKEILADFLGVELVLDEKLKNKIHRQLQDRYQLVPQNNNKQAYVFPNGTIFPNHYGTAPGLAISLKSTTYILLPGPPKELIPMFTRYIRPYLIRLFPDHRKICYTDLLFFGMGESFLEDQIKDLIIHAKNPHIATYLSKSGVQLRITGHGDDESVIHKEIEQLKKEILNRIGEYCYSEKNESLEEVLVQNLKKHRKTISCIEGFTGGLFSHLLSTVPGSHSVFRGASIGEAFLSNKTRKWVPSPKQNWKETYKFVWTPDVLAEQALDQWGSDFGISISGIYQASSLGKMKGRIDIGLAEKNEFTRIYRLSLSGSAQRIQESAARYAMFILQQRLKKGEATS